MSPDLAATIAMLQSLKWGDPVTVSGVVRDHEVHVQIEWHRRDGGGFGSAEHAAVLVGFGPGRWNRAVSAAQIIAGDVTLTPGHTITNGAPA